MSQHSLHLRSLCVTFCKFKKSYEPPKQLYYAMMSFAVVTSCHAICASWPFPPHLSLLGSLSPSFSVIQCSTSYSLIVQANNLFTCKIYSDSSHSWSQNNHAELNHLVYIRCNRSIESLVCKKNCCFIFVQRPSNV